MKIDIRTGQLATELTPSQFVQTRFGLVIPDTIKDSFVLGQDQEWARVLNASVSPTDKSDASDLPVRIDSPADHGRRVGHCKHHRQGGLGGLRVVPDRVRRW